LTETPLLVIHISFVLVICYVLYQGIEVLGRTAEIFLFVLILLGIIGNFFVLVSGDITFQQIRPPLEHGWGPIITTAFPTITTFPFGEMFAFMMLMPYLNKTKLVKKTWLSALICSGLILSWTAFLNMTVLGAEVMERSTFPTLATIGKVSLFDFIERLDAIVVLTLLLTVFCKTAIFLYSAVIGIVDLFKLKSHQQIILPVGIILIFTSMTIATSFSEHLEEGFDASIKFVHVPFFIIIPFLMLIISVIKNYMKKKNSAK
jgi:spore germination protein KB